MRYDMVAQIKQGDHATWAITPHVFVGRKKGWDQILWKWYSTTSGPVALPQVGKKEGCYYCEVFPHSGCPPTKDLWSLSFSPTTDSDLAFGADPFGDRAASEDLPQPESQPNSEGEPFYCELYPHCGCDPREG